MKRRFWISILAQLALVIMLPVVLARTGLSARQLLIGTSVWFAAVVLWSTLGPSSFFELGQAQSDENRVYFRLRLFLSAFHLRVARTACGRDIQAHNEMILRQEFECNGDFSTVVHRAPCHY